MIIIDMLDCLESGHHNALLWTGVPSWYSWSSLSMVPVFHSGKYASSM